MINALAASVQNHMHLNTLQSSNDFAITYGN